MIPIRAKNNILLLLNLFCLSSALVAQKNAEYQGAFKVKDYSGDAVYSYKLVDTDTILNGAFQLKRSSLEALLENEDISFLFKGDFKNGFPNGGWRFQFGEFQSNSQSKVVDYEYRVLISGVQEEGSGLIKNGKPDGVWTYEVNKIKDSEKEKTLFKSDITFKNGVPQRNFQIENEKAILVGRFLRNGLAHDEWTSYDVETIENTESWFFEEGLLKKIETTQEGVRKDIPGFNGKAKAYETIDLDERFLKILEITMLERYNEIKIRESLPKLLNENSAYYQKIDGILGELGTSDFKSSFKVQVPYFALDSTEIKNLNSIGADYLVAKDISESLLHNSQLNILKRSDVDALYYHNCVAKIQELFLNPIEKFVSLKDQEIISFIDQNKFISGLWSEGKPATAISVPLDTTLTKRIFELQNAASFNFTGDNINTIQQLTSYAKQSLVYVQQALSDKLTQAERFEALTQLEEKLIQQNGVLLTQIDAMAKNLPVKHKSALENIKKVADASLSTYATIKDQNEKLIYGETLKPCFDNFSSLTNAIIALPNQAKEIDSLYTDAVFNPFMSVVMDEEVKKRVVSAYHKVLTPYFLQTASKELNCENAEQLNYEIQQTYERMLLLRDEETKKIERKLRREQDPKTVLQLLSVQSKKEAK